MSNSTQHNFDEILNACLDLIHSGVSVAECLDRFPEMQAELEPILELTAGISQISIEPPTGAAISAGKAKMQAALAAKSAGAAQATYAKPNQFVTQIRSLYRFLFSSEASPVTRMTRTVFASLLLVFSLFL